MMLATPIPPSARQLNSTNVAVPGMNGRSASPTVTAASAIQTSLLGNVRATIRGASEPKATKQAAGSAVSSPATTPPMPREVRISSSTGPTLVTAGRRLNAASTRATKITAPAARPGVTIPSVTTVLLGSGLPSPAGLRLPWPACPGLPSPAGSVIDPGPAGRGHSRGAVTLYSVIRQ